MNRRHGKEESITTETQDNDDISSQISASNHSSVSNEAGTGSTVSDKSSEDKSNSQEEDEEEDEESKSQSSDSKSDETDASTDLSENDSDSENEENTDYIFNGILKAALTYNQPKREEIISKLLENGMDESEACRESYDRLIPKYRKALRMLLVNHLLHIVEVRRHPMVKAIMSRVHKLESKGMDREEAIPAAVAYRKHLIDRLVPSYSELTELYDSDGMSCEDEN